MNEIPSCEDITNADLILSANRALFCEIRQYMRKINIVYNKNKKLITLIFYYESPPSKDELDYDVFGTISAEMSTDFSKDINWEEKVIVIPYPNKLPDQGICVFRRYEPDPDF
jgi:hypothetical protein